MQNDITKRQNDITSDRDNNLGSGERAATTQVEPVPPYEAPRNAVEAKVAEIWAAVLGVEKVGIQDNFLLLGGESLLAGQVAARIRDQFNVEVSLRSIFVDTVAQISAQLSGAVGSH